MTARMLPAVRRLVFLQSRRRLLPGRRKLGYIPVMLSKELLDILVCPKCKGDLTYERESSALDCPKCRLRYRVEGDIPVMLIDEAQSLDSTPA
ncbi:MAG: Trm112 family protein [Pseudomonadota bacterium]